jgi:hypothetical protein
MSRQVPHVEDIATGTPTAGLVPVSAGAGLAPAWGAGSGGGGGSGRLVYEEWLFGAAGVQYIFSAYPMGRIVASRNHQALSLVQGRDFSAIYYATLGRPSAQFLTVSGTETIGLLYAAERPSTTGLIYSTDAQGKCLSLWNGVSNDPPPAGWETIGFNDSAWTASVQVADDLLQIFHNAHSIWQAVASPTEPGGQAILHRRSFTLTADQIAGAIGANLRTWADDFVDEVYVNGTAVALNDGLTLDTQGPILGFNIPVSTLIAGTNVIAIHARDATDAPALWHLQYRFDLL